MSYMSLGFGPEWGFLLVVWPWASYYALWGSSLMCKIGIKNSYLAGEWGLMNTFVMRHTLSIGWVVVIIHERKKSGCGARLGRGLEAPIVSHCGINGSHQECPECSDDLLRSSKKWGVPRQEWDADDLLPLLSSEVSDQVHRTECSPFRANAVQTWEDLTMEGYWVSLRSEGPGPRSLGCQWKGNCFPLHTSYFPGRTYLLNITHKFQMKAGHLFPSHVTFPNTAHTDL